MLHSAVCTLCCGGEKRVNVVLDVQELRGARVHLGITHKILAQKRKRQNKWSHLGVSNLKKKKNVFSSVEKAKAWVQLLPKKVSKK